MDKLDKIEQKIEKITESIHSVDKTLARQEQHLAEHIRRTKIAETNIELLRNDIKPLTAHVQRVEGALKLIGIIAVFIGIATGIFNLIKQIL
jgi:archaellum component FlaC